MTDVILHVLHSSTDGWNAAAADPSLHAAEPGGKKFCSPRARVVSHVPPVAGCLVRRNWAFAGVTPSLHPLGAAAGSLHGFAITSADFVWNWWSFELVMRHTGLQPVCPVWPLTLDIYWAFPPHNCQWWDLSCHYTGLSVINHKRRFCFRFSSLFCSDQGSFCPVRLPPSTQCYFVSCVWLIFTSWCYQNMTNLSDFAGHLHILLSKMLLQVWQNFVISFQSPLWSNAGVCCLLCGGLSMALS